MLNPNFMLRAKLIEFARVGIVNVTIRRQDNSLFTFPCTLRDTSMECAKMNADLYYKSIGSSRYKEQAKRKKLKVEKETWEQKLDKSINLLYVVNTDDFRWFKLNIRRMVEIEPIEYIG